MADRYWVNRSGDTSSLGSGTGTWNDTNNWSATSGGSGGAGVPTSSDNIFFDNSSASDCTLDTTPTIIDWTMSSGYSGATLSLGTYTVTCTGNVSIASNDNLLDAGTSTVDMAGASTQNVGNPSLSNAFYNLDISNNTQLSDDIYIVGGQLTIDADQYLNLFPGSSYDVHLRGFGTMLVLNGYTRADNSGNKGIIYFELDEADAIMNIPGGTGFGENNSYTAAAIRMVLIGAISGTFSMQGDINNVDNMMMYGDNSSGVATLNTNDYNFEVYSYWFFGEDISGEAELVCNFGSATITVPQLCRFVCLTDSTFNMQSSTWDVGCFSKFPDRTLTFNVGTSSVTVNTGIGESWQSTLPNPPDPPFYDLTLDAASVICYTNFTVQHRMTVTEGTTVEVQRKISGTGEVYARALTGDVNLEFTPGYRNEFGSFNLAGQGAYEVSLYSATPGTPWSGVMTGYSEVNHVTVSDSEMVGQEIDALDSTNTDGGNNGPSWVFDDNQQDIVIS